MDTISRRAAINAIDEYNVCGYVEEPFEQLEKALLELPSAQPEPLSHAYAKYVLTWLIDYQIKTAELQGRYSPYEVLSWVANDWRKENE